MSPDSARLRPVRHGVSRAGESSKRPGIGGASSTGRAGRPLCRASGVRSCHLRRPWTVKRSTGRRHLSRFVPRRPSLETVGKGTDECVRVRGCSSFGPFQTEWTELLYRASEKEGVLLDRGQRAGFVPVVEWGQGIRGQVEVGKRFPSRGKAYPGRYAEGTIAIHVG